MLWSQDRIAGLRVNECVCMVVATGRHGRLQYSSNRRASEWQGNSLQLAQVSRLLGASQWIGGVGAGDLVKVTLHRK